MLVFDPKVVFHKMENEFAPYLQIFLKSLKLNLPPKLVLFTMYLQKEISFVGNSSLILTLLAVGKFLGTVRGEESKV